jgi:hypothetical protein
MRERDWLLQDGAGEKIAQRVPNLGCAARLRHLPGPRRPRGILLKDPEENS